MRYEKASAEIITFVNGCFITTSPGGSGSHSYELREEHEDEGISGPSRSRDYRPNGRRKY